jgi:hypothetical protein
MSTVTIHGVARALREGQITLGDDYGEHGQTVVCRRPVSREAFERDRQFWFAADQDEARGGE